MEGLKRSTRNLFTLHTTCQALAVGLAPQVIRGGSGIKPFPAGSRTAALAAQPPDARIEEHSVSYGGRCFGGLSFELVTYPVPSVLPGIQSTGIALRGRRQ